jgi:hypothetical protein
LKGVDALKEELADYPKRVQTRAIETGLREAALQLSAAMRREAYTGPAKTKRGFSGKLGRALRIAVGKPGRKRTEGKAWVGLKKIPGESRARNYYRTLEFGRQPYRKKRGATAKVGRHIKQVGVNYKGSPHPLRPFFARAWAANREAVAETLINATRRALELEAKKSYARTKRG